MPESVDPGQLLLVALVGAFSLYSAGHALLHKREPRSALGWLVACLAWPLFGATAYWMFGRNRIRTRGRKLRTRFPSEASAEGEDTGTPRPRLPEYLQVSENVTGRPLIEGNAIRPLECGEEAYPAMLEAIDQAEHSVRLATYIFDNDTVGREFADALERAHTRGVDVKVLVDGIGECYSVPRISTALKRRGVRAERFLPPSLIPPSLYINLRNHRKLLVVDRQLAFTGGMNISDRHFVDPPRRRRPVVDLHFEVRGPVVAQMEGVFLEDWFFATGEDDGEPQPPPLEPVGETACRAISDGPNEDLDKLKWALLGAISAAKRSIRIMTPYFIPSTELTSALNLAALRGVEVEIIVPQKLDIPPVGWATRNHLAMLLTYGSRVYSSPGPFVHTKLFLADDEYALIGSANLDPRSLRLNFEFNLELHGRECAETLGRHFERARAESIRITEDALRSRPLPVKLRDSLAFLFSPYI